MQKQVIGVADRIAEVSQVLHSMGTRHGCYHGLSSIYLGLYDLPWHMNNMTSFSKSERPLEDDKYLAWKGKVLWFP